MGDQLAIDEGRFVAVHGLEQWVTLRGADAANPALMMVTGAGAAFSPMAPLFAPWERPFTLVQWDQPGAGATLARHGPTPSPFTYDRLAADGIAVAAWARARLGVPLALFCISAGSVTGLKMVRARPDLFGAYVGNGQIVDWAAQERDSYRMILQRARAAGDAAAIAEIEGVGSPPWADIAGDVVKGRYAYAPTPAEAAVMGSEAMARARHPPADARYLARGLTPPADPSAAALAAYQALRPELAAFDARTLGLAFEVPMIFLQGAQDAHTPAAAVRAYAAEITAPKVVYRELEEGGHLSTFLVDRLLELLLAEVRPLLAAGP